LPDNVENGAWSCRLRVAGAGFRIPVGAAAHAHAHRGTRTAHTIPPCAPQPARLDNRLGAADRTIRVSRAASGTARQRCGGAWLQCSQHRDRPLQL